MWWKIALEWLILPVLIVGFKWLAPKVAKAYARERSKALEENTQEMRHLRSALDVEKQEREKDRQAINDLGHRVSELFGQVSVLVKYEKDKGKNS